MPTVCRTVPVHGKPLVSRCLSHGAIYLFVQGRVVPIATLSSSDCRSTTVTKAGGDTAYCHLFAIGRRVQKEKLITGRIGQPRKPNVDLGR